MKKERLTMAAAVAIAGALALTACSSAELANESEGEGATIDWWGWNPDDTQYQAILDMFAEDHPEITVNYRFIQYSDYLNTLRLGLTSGEGPDVFGIQTGAMTNQFASLAADLTPYLEEDLGADWASLLISADQLQVEGAQVGLPWMVTGGGTIEVNMTLLESLGLEAPENLQEWQDVCEALGEEDLDCMVQGAKDAWQNLDVFQALANQAAPGYFYDALAGDQPFDSPQMIEAFDAWLTLFDTGIIQDGAFGTTAYPDAADEFRSGGAGMIAFGTWQNADMTQTRLDSYAETYGDDAISETEFLLVPFPSIVDPSATPELTLFGGPDVAWAMDTSSDAPDAAWTFLSWLTTSQPAQEQRASLMLQPALVGVPVDTSDVVTDRQREAIDAQADALANMVGPREIANADVSAALGDALAAVASGSMSSADAAASVQSAIDAAASQ